MKIIIVLTLLLANLLAEYAFDEAHAQVNFKIKHMSILSLNGSFNDFSASINFNKDEILSFLNGKIIANSIDTGNKKRDKHLRNEDFFFVKKHPKITFEMTAYEGDDKEGEVKGNLTMRGVTKEVILQANFSELIKNPYGQNVKAVSLTGSINRKDFNIGKKYGNATIGKNVFIEIAFEVVKKQ